MENQALEAIKEIAQGLQEFVYNRQEGDKENPAESMVVATYIQVNNLLIDVANKYKKIVEDTDTKLDPIICADELTEGEKVENFYNKL